MIIKSLNNTTFLKIVLLLILILKLTISINTGLFEDEAIYWNWSQSPDPSYSLTTLAAINFFTQIFGSSAEFIVRLPALTVNFLLIFFFYRIGNLYKIPERKILLSLILFFSVPFVTIYTSFISPDSLLLLFAVAVTYFTLKIIKFNKLQDWIFCGVSFGLLILSKYLGLIYLTIAVIYFFSNRKFFGEKFFTNFSAFMISLLIVISPLLIWNLIYEPVWLKYYLLTDADKINTALFERLSVFFLSQISILLPFIFLLIIFLAVKIFKQKNKSREIKFLLYAFSAMLVIFILSSFTGKIKGNWSFIMYIPLLISVMFFQYNNFKKILITMCFIFNLFLLVLLNLNSSQIINIADNSFGRYINNSYKYYWPDHVKSECNDRNWEERIIKMKFWRNTISEIENEIKTSDVKFDFIASNNYNLSPLLNFYLIDSSEVYVIGDLRFKYINSAEVNNQLTGKDAVIISYGDPEIEYLKTKFENINIVKNIKTKLSDNISQEFKIIHCKNFNPYLALENNK